MKSKRKRRGKRGGKKKGRPGHNSTISLSTEQQQSLLVQLVDPNPQTRESACVAIANVFETGCPDHVLNGLAGGGLFEKLKSRLCDEKPSIRLSACFALLNISKHCSRQRCRQIQKAEVPFVVFKYVDFLLKSGNQPSAQGVEESLIVALQLLSNLYERLELMLALQNCSALESLFCCMDHTEARVRQHACSLLHLCTEDNTVLVAELWRNPASIHRLVELVGKYKEKSDLDVLHLCGVLSNLFVGRPPADRQTALGVLLTVLNSKLRVGACFPVRQGDDEESRAWESRLQVQLLSLEVLANALIEFGESPSEFSQILALGVETTLMAVLENGRKVLEQNDLPENVRAGIAVLCERSTGALDNMVQMLPPEQLPQANICRIWNNVTSFVFSCLARNAETEQQTLCALAALQWTILRVCTEARSVDALNAVMSEDSVLSMVKLSRSETVPLVRANAHGCLQILFTITDDTCQRHIAQAVNSGLGDMSVLVVVQALETVFSIYGNTTFDQLYSQLKVHSILKSVQPRLRSKQEDSLTMLTLDPRVLSNALVNLEAFIAYKENSFDSTS